MIQWVQLQWGIDLFDGQYVVLSKILLTWYYALFVIVILLMLIAQYFVIKIVRMCRNRMRSRRVMPELQGDARQDIVGAN